ncbi:unnamed protein product [Heterobilharzia americana]|nr:unnamed protein product [Heterobilharzia americana]
MFSKCLLYITIFLIVTLVIDLASSDKHKYKFKGKRYRRSSGVSMIGNYYLISSSILASITVYHRLAVCR